MNHDDYAMPVFESFAHSDDDNPGEGEDSEGQSMNAAGIYSGGTGRRTASTTTATQDGSLKRKRPGGKGKRKIAIEYIADKSKRAVTFSKRKAGIFTKARELSTLTGSSLLLLVVSESGVVYTYTSEKFIPMVTQDAGKNMIAACLNGTVNLSERFSSSIPGQSRLSGSSSADAQPKRGGDILLKKAFESGTLSAPAGGGDDVTNLGSDEGRVGQSVKNRHAGKDAAGRDQDGDGREDVMEERSPSPAIAALPLLPPLPKYDSPEASTSERHSRRSGPTDASASTGIHHEEAIHHNAKSQDIIITGIGADDREDGDEDISDDECDRRMRTLRRSLSIERRYERISEEQRPRVVRHAVGRESGLASAGRDHGQDASQRTITPRTAAGTDATDVQNKSTGTGTSTMSALDLTPDAFRGFGYSFARSAEDWDSVKQRFDIPPSVEDSFNHQSQQQDHLGNSRNHGHRPQVQSRTDQHSSRGPRVATMPKPMQMAALPELPR